MELLGGCCSTLFLRELSLLYSFWLIFSQSSLSHKGVCVSQIFHLCVSEHSIYLSSHSPDLSFCLNFQTHCTKQLWWCLWVALIYGLKDSWVSIWVGIWFLWILFGSTPRRGVTIGESCLLWEEEYFPLRVCTMATWPNCSGWLLTHENTGRKKLI